MKQIGLAVMQYTQDYDETYPLTLFNYSSPLAPTVSAEWSTVLAPYIKSGDLTRRSGGVLSCPSFPNAQEGDQYHFRMDLFPVDDPADGAPLAPGNVSTLSVVDAPSEKVMMLEAGQNGMAASWGYPYFVTGQWAWASSGLSAANNYTPATDRALANGDCDYPTGGHVAWAGCGQLPRYRHNNMSNFLWLDGHVKSKTRGSLNWYRDIYIANVSDGGLPGTPVN